MYVDGVRERITEIKEKIGINEHDLEYPTLPNGIEMKNKEDSQNPLDTNMKLEDRADKVLKEIAIVENNREKRERLTEQDAILR